MKERRGPRIQKPVEMFFFTAHKQWLETCCGMRRNTRFILTVKGAHDLSAPNTGLFEFESRSGAEMYTSVLSCEDILLYIPRKIMKCLKKIGRSPWVSGFARTRVSEMLYFKQDNRQLKLTDVTTNRCFYTVLQMERSKKTERECTWIGHISFWSKLKVLNYRAKT